MIINEATRQYVSEHAHDDVKRLALKGTKDPEVDFTLALQQIAGRQMAHRKLPTWAETEGLLFPPHLNMEQCSSEQTARYKQRVVERLMAERRKKKAGDADKTNVFADLTGGFGVDFYWMSQGFEHRVYVEQNEALYTLAKQNFHQLGLSCSVHCCDTAIYLKEMAGADVVFMDPARRDEHGGRTYGMADCTPNVLEILPELLKKAHFIVIKLSPMLDWRKAVSDIENSLATRQQSSSIPQFHVSEVHIVSVDNECKELLLVVSREPAEALKLFCVNNAHEFAFFPCLRNFSPQASDCESAVVGLRVRSSRTASNPRGLYDLQSDRPVVDLFLYEPNASVMKAGCFAELVERFPVSQLSSNSHLFISEEAIAGFPGRMFQIQAISSMNKQGLRQVLKDVERANISVRNFPMSPEELRRKLKLKDGGNVFLFATTLHDGRHRLLICRKIG